MSDPIAAFVAAHRWMQPQIGVWETRGAGRREFCQLLAAMGVGTGAEIGVWKGEFSAQLCAAVPGLRLMAVDPWEPFQPGRGAKDTPERFERAYETAIARLTPYHVDVWRQPSIAAARLVANQALDFVYIDGAHDRVHVEQDLAVWTPKVRPGGLVAGHDYFEHPRCDVIVPVTAAARRQKRPLYVLSADKQPSFFWVAR